MTDYTGNTNKEKAEQKKQIEKEKTVERIVDSEVIVKKRSIGRRFKDIFFGGEFKSAMRYVGADVLLPAARNLLVDSITRGAERVVYGEAPTRRRTPEYRGHTQYNAPVRRGLMPDPRGRTNLPDQPPHPFHQNRQEVDDLIFPTREEAERVISTMIEIIDTYDCVSLRDLYELVGIPFGHVDLKWGWTYLNNADIRQTRQGYLLSLPPMEPI